MPPPAPAPVPSSPPAAHRQSEEGGPVTGVPQRQEPCLVGGKVVGRDGDVIEQAAAGKGVEVEGRLGRLAQRQRHLLSGRWDNDLAALAAWKHG